MRKPPSPPKFADVFSATGSDFWEMFNRGDVREFVRDANDKYLHWHKLRYHPRPAGLSAEAAWMATELSRTSQRRQLPITFEKERELTYWSPPQHVEWLHKIDQEGGGTIVSGQRIPDDSDRYLYSSLMEEAIASSQLEGASTTRKVAKEMLQRKRQPRNKYEQMIANNYRAILAIKNEFQSDNLTPDLLMHLQSILVHDAAEHQGIDGRFRRADEAVVVEDARTGETVHTPPHARTLEYRIQEICDFANSPSKPFVHPVIKAIVLHFAIAFVHPFVDGNGRTARAVFYWYMLKNKYWLFEYLSISRILLDGPAKYAQAFLYSETDHGDVTYFIHFHLQVIKRAIQDLHAYLRRQQQQIYETSQILHSQSELNKRQAELVGEFLRQPMMQCTIKQHATKFGVTYITARNDLNGLVSANMLRSRKVGKEYLFFANEDLMKTLRRLNRERKAEPLAHHGESQEVVRSTIRTRNRKEQDDMDAGQLPLF